MEAIIAILGMIFSIASLWCYGTLLKAALGISKWNILLILIPVVNIVMVIIWGMQAHNKLIEQDYIDG